MAGEKGTVKVRIIAGRWRGRRLAVPAVSGLRPTLDRVRETLFNWLGPKIQGACCLDLFAGTGALGFEALSRGAARVVLVERDKRVVVALTENLRALTGAGDRSSAHGQGSVHVGTRSDDARVMIVPLDAFAYLRSPPVVFDVVFLDPPFEAGLLSVLCARLEAGRWLEGHARIYLEMRRSEALPALPTGWAWVREAVAGDVRYALARKQSISEAWPRTGEP